MGGKVSNGGRNKNNCPPHVTWPIPRPQWCVRETFFTYFVSLGQWKITLLNPMLSTWTLTWLMPHVISFWWHSTDLPYWPVLKSGCTLLIGSASRVSWIMCSCVLNASLVNVDWYPWSIPLLNTLDQPSIDTQLTLHWHLGWHSNDAPSTSWSTVGREWPNFWSIDMSWSTLS